MVKRRTDLTAEQVRELLEYDPVTGHFTWKVRASPRVHVGDKAGRSDSLGYTQIGIKGKCYQANRLAWLYMTGEWPAHEVDHRDLNKSNDAWDNLREATKAQNCANRKIFKTNTSGYKGVSWHKKQKKWNAQIKVRGKTLWLGSFSNIDHAATAYREAAIRLNGDYARTA